VIPKVFRCSSEKWGISKSIAEAESITKLLINTRSIISMEGIEAFVNLDTLACNWVALPKEGIGKLKSLDVSNNKKLILLSCGNNPLTKLDISNNTALKQIVFTHNYWLTEVCVWTMPFPPDGVSVNMNHCPDLYFTTDCSKKKPTCRVFIIHKT
jgi:hypothetical protein